MMLTNIFLPFFLTVNVNLSKPLNCNMIYSYHVSKVTIIYKEPFEHTQLTSTIACRPILLSGLCCFMHDITSETTVKYSSWGIGKVKTDILKVEKWFQMWFNNRGLLRTVIPPVNSEIKNFIKHISQQFSLGINIADYRDKIQIDVPMKFITDEKTPMGNCKTDYDIDITYIKNANKETNSIFEIRPLILTHYVKQENLIRTYIMKYRTKCDYSTISDNATLNETTVANYGHGMKAEGDKFQIITTMDVYLSKPISTPWVPTFSETTEINLINISIRSLCDDL
ncbi:PREDICTED: uncharacterized protein LOC105153048 [Acromyrmex echinatior]|uniref:uncharacterized protein LOC105153048 n=1 Tax=Acromyrmex echinatior TaxID=103372 RepID=UPI000580F148|nr:PREDICTED: uncharacterized protein LOC105153048 [Acromyrmex echinatior]